MSTVSELRQEAQSKGQQLVDEYNTLGQKKEEFSKQLQEVQTRQNQILIAVEKINGEIDGYNKIEPPVDSEEGNTDVPPDAA